MEMIYRMMVSDIPVREISGMVSNECTVAFRDCPNAYMLLVGFTIGAWAMGMGIFMYRLIKERMENEPDTSD